MDERDKRKAMSVPGPDRDKTPKRVVRVVEYNGETWWVDQVLEKSKGFAINEGTIHEVSQHVLQEGEYVICTIKNRSKDG
jgi:hypothetical protein